MPSHQWFIFDLGNVVVKLDYERVLASVCSLAEVSRDELVKIMEEAGGYRDLERGLVTFEDFYRLLREGARYRGSFRDFHRVWSDFFAGPVDGIESILDRARRQYRVAFLSNSNEVHAEVIPRMFSFLFKPEDRFIFSHHHKCAKPDPVLFRTACDILGVLPAQTIFVDDLLENVVSARNEGMAAFQFFSSGQLIEELEGEGLLEKSG